MLTTIVSGGQSGVDRAALDVAQELGLARGGWCPKGRRAEDGTIPLTYPLRETPSEIHAQRTEWNVRDSDGTLVLTQGRPTEGTALTIDLSSRLGKAHLVVDLNDQPDPALAREWLVSHHIGTLNVAGPRESKCPGIYTAAVPFLRQILREPGLA
jgi:Circularly permutated YpsA SLOG family